MELTRAITVDTDYINRVVSLHQPLNQRTSSIFCVELALPVTKDEKLLTIKLSYAKMLKNLIIKNLHVTGPR